MREPEVTSRIMSAIKSKNTKPEKILGRILWSSGLRYRKSTSVFGHPDFVFIKSRVAVFCDGDFWHGNNWRIRGLASLDVELSSYNEYWKNKILKNVARDNFVDKTLAETGWTVIRFWESDIVEFPNSCAEYIVNIVKGNKIANPFPR